MASLFCHSTAAYSSCSAFDVLYYSFSRLEKQGILVEAIHDLSRFFRNCPSTIFFVFIVCSVVQCP